MKEKDEYEALLKKAEKSKESKEQRDKQSRRKRSGRRKSGKDKGSAGKRRNTNDEDGGDVAAPPTTTAPQPPTSLPNMGAGYEDPMGKLPERPKTAAARNSSVGDDLGFDDEVGDDLLPD